ncbi:MAG: hypothetical protein DCC49_13840 [Acidobacteria bacterium]|nr:MAG: hypothetical protein DCC49_13840 [Acidobacteriota bacterium]
MRSRNSDGTYSNYFFVTNTHGDVVALTDRDGKIVNRYAYGPWGEATRVSEQVHQPFRYAGYFYEPTADLYWLRARWYDAGTGRFLSRDPMVGALQDLVGLNTYIYAEDSPATKTDPTGYGPRSNRVIFWFHGTNASPDSRNSWGEYFRNLFPGTDVELFGYQISWEDTCCGGEEGLVREASATIRWKGAGRVIYAAGHSEGGDILFRAVSRSGYFAAAVVTMGVPTRTISDNDWMHVGYWADICSTWNDWVCRDIPPGVGQGPDEYNVVWNSGAPGVGGHSNYSNNPEVAEIIKRVFGQRGAR